MNRFLHLLVFAQELPEDIPSGGGSVTNCGMATIVNNATSLLASILAWLSDMTEWILSDDLAILGFTIAFVMLGVKVLHSLIKFSW